MTLAWSHPARANLLSAFAYLSEERPSAIPHLIDRIEKTLQILNQHPSIGRPGRVVGTREIVISGTPFIIPYRIKHQTIEILAFLHAARRWPDTL